jgi:hypothetical protein
MGRHPNVERETLRELANAVSAVKAAKAKRARAIYDASEAATA